jgi:hypothetical protein
METTLELPASDNRRVIVSQDVDETAWLEARRGFLTASDMYTWVAQDKPAWWSSTREQIIHEKLTGEPRVFGNTMKKRLDASRKMAHGRFDEENNLRKFSHMTGLHALSRHELLGNLKWPNLACTLDAICAEVVDANIPNPEFTSDPGMIVGALKAARYIGGTGIIEMKQTSEYGGKKWATGIPEWYLLQPQMQMAIAEVDWCLVVCQCGADNMFAHCIERDEDFEHVMQEANDSFEEMLEREAA